MKYQLGSRLADGTLHQRAAGSDLRTLAEMAIPGDVLVDEAGEEMDDPRNYVTYQSLADALTATRGAYNVAANWGQASGPVWAMTPAGPKCIGQVADYRHDPHAAARHALGQGKDYWVVLESAGGTCAVDGPYTVL